MRARALQIGWAFLIGGMLIGGASVAVTVIDMISDHEWIPPGEEIAQ
jgi:hypothetical protein